MSQFSMALKCVWKRTSDFAVGEGAFEMIAAEGSSGQADNNDDNDDDDNDDLSE
jgi:hypothetical protein